MTRIAMSLTFGFLVATTAGCSTTSSPAAPSMVGSAAVLGTNEPVPAALSGGPSSAPRAAAGARPGDQTIVGLVLKDDDEFDVLQAAVVRAELVEALNGRKQYTVFAPTDAAFISTLKVANEAAAIQAVEGLELGTLQNILLYHVMNGRRISVSVLGAPRYQMLNGGTLTREELVAAGIADTDISASNGIVHVINAVLMP